MAMNLLGLILIASLSLCIVAVSLRLRAPARLRWVERVDLGSRRDVLVEE
jgi:hypothetical protein